jgi:hypothetical protein
MIAGVGILLLISAGIGGGLLYKGFSYRQQSQD